MQVSETSVESEGSDKLKDFLTNTAKGIKDVNDIHSKFTSCSIDYDELLRMSKDDLSEIMKSVMNMDALTCFRIIDALKNISASQIYKDINKPTQQTKAILLSSKQNDFVVGIHSKQAISNENSAKLQKLISKLDETSKNTKNKINNQYTTLIKILKTRQNALNNNIDKIVNEQKDILNKELSLAVKTKDVLKNISIGIENCLSSNSLNFNAKQSKIDEIIKKSSNELKLLKKYIDENMMIETNTEIHYKCNEKDFEQFIANKMDYIGNDKIEFLKEPTYNKQDQTILFTVRYTKNMTKYKFKVEGYFDNEEKEDDDNKDNDDEKTNNNNNNWIEFGNFNLEYNDNDNNQNVKISIANKKIKIGLYRIRIRLNNDNNEFPLNCLATNLLKIESLPIIWNPEDKDDYIILTNNNLTVTNKYHAKNNHLIRSNVGYSNGTICYQIILDTHSQDGHGYPYIGFATNQAPRVASYGKAEYFWGFKVHAPGQKFQKIRSSFNGQYTWSQPDEKIQLNVPIVLKLDMTSPSLSLCQNGIKIATITNMEWKQDEKLFPALYLGCIRDNKITTSFHVL